MHIKYLFLLFAVANIVSCKDNNSEICEGKFIEIQKYMMMFDGLYESPQYLDSALNIVIDMEKDGICPKYKTTVLSRKAEIYYYKKEYDLAIETWKNVEEISPIMLNIIINKMKIKQAEIKGDSVWLDQLYREIITDYEERFKDRRFLYKILLRNKDVNKAYFSDANGTLVELFHYKFQIEDSMTVFRQIDSLEKKIRGNEEYFERLRNLFREKNYSVLLE